MDAHGIVGRRYQVGVLNVGTEPSRYRPLPLSTPPNTHSFPISVHFNSDSLSVQIPSVVKTDIEFAIKEGNCIQAIVDSFK